MCNFGICQERLLTLFCGSRRAWAAVAAATEVSASFGRLALWYRPSIWPSGLLSAANLPYGRYLTEPSRAAPNWIKRGTISSMSSISNVSNGEYPVEH